MLLSPTIVSTPIGDSAWCWQWRKGRRTDEKLLSLFASVCDEDVMVSQVASCVDGVNGKSDPIRDEVDECDENVE